MNAFERQLTEHVSTHRRSGILLDTNVLLLLIMSQFRPSLVGGHRLEKYALADADLLEEFVARFRRIFTTVHVLTETSNLAAQALKGTTRDELFSWLYPKFSGADSKALVPLRVRSRALNEAVFVRLGLTDAALTAVAAKGRLLLTDDLDLHVAASSLGASSVNFTHMREAAGLL